MASRFSKFVVSADLDETEFAVDSPKEKKQEKAWLFRPGAYKDVVVKSVEELPDPCRADDTWIKLRLTLQQDKREIRKLILVPTKDLTYGPDKASSCFRMLSKFLEAFGVDLNIKNAQEVIPAIFEDPNCFIGQRVDITVGHKGYYAHFQDKNNWFCYDRFDKPVCHKDTSNPISFPSPEAVENYVTDFMKKDFSPFPDVKFVNPPTTPSDKPLIMPKKAVEKKSVKW